MRIERRQKSKPWAAHRTGADGTTQIQLERWGCQGYGRDECPIGLSWHWIGKNGAFYCRRPKHTLGGWASEVSKINSCILYKYFYKLNLGKAEVFFLSRSNNKYCSYSSAVWCKLARSTVSKAAPASLKASRALEVSRAQAHAMYPPGWTRDATDSRSWNIEQCYLNAYIWTYLYTNTKIKTFGPLFTKIMTTEECEIWHS